MAMNMADINALPRLVLMASELTGARHIVEPAANFKANALTEGFLDDLLIRNASNLDTLDEVNELIQQIRDFSNHTATLMRLNYSVEAGGARMANELYGINIDETAVLWLTRRAATPADVVDIVEVIDGSLLSITEDDTEDSNVEILSTSPASLRRALQLTPTDQSDNTVVKTPEELWFEEIRNMPLESQPWLLDQLEAIFERLERTDLYDTLVEIISGSKEEG